MKGGRKALPNGRSKGEAKHIRIYWWAFKSPAYRSLSCHARCVLEEMLFLHDGKNNGAIPASIRFLMERVHAGPHQVTRALAELEHKGFITRTRHGSFCHKTGARNGEATTWCITMLEGSAGEQPTKDFMRWDGSEPASEKQTTVTTPVTPRYHVGNRRADSGAKNGQSVTTSVTVKPDFGPPTVTTPVTSIVNHVEGREADPPTLESNESNPPDMRAPPAAVDKWEGHEAPKPRALTMADALAAPNISPRHRKPIEFAPGAIAASAARIGIPRIGASGPTADDMRRSAARIGMPLKVPTPTTPVLQ